MILALMIGVSACSDSSLVPNLQKKGGKQAISRINKISKIDGKPILKVSAADLYTTNLFNKIRNKLAAKDGYAIIHALKMKAATLNKQQTPSVAVMNLKKVAQPVAAGSKTNGQAVTGNVSLADVGSELQVQDDDGEIEDFVLTLQPYNPDPVQESGKQLVAGMVTGKANVAGNNDTYLALDPDFFYIHDNANGQENWPVTFPATSLTDGSQIMVTAHRSALGETIYHFDYSGSSNGTALSTANTSGSHPNLVFVIATPVVHPNIFHPCEEGEPCHQPPPPPGGGGGSGGGSDDGGLCQKVYHRGSAGGSPSDGDTYFNLYLVHLWNDGEGGNGAELQMFVENNDDYTKCFPQKYKYRFDSVIRLSTHGRSTVITSVDGNKYKVPDINNEAEDYSLLTLSEGDFDGNGDWDQNGINKGFPVFNLTGQTAPFRLVLSDDDKDYPHFSTNHVSSIHGTQIKDISTYNMNTGTWNVVSTGFTANPFDNGNSDDPIQQSGVRNITYSNVVNHSGYIPGIGPAVKAKKTYPVRASGSTYFKYIFGLQVQ